MPTSAQLTGLRFSPASRDDSANGLLGWCSFVLPSYGLRLDCIAVRRTASGRLALSFPCRDDTSGRRHWIVRPIDTSSREALEREVLAALGLGGGAP